MYHGIGDEHQSRPAADWDIRFSALGRAFSAETLSTLSRRVDQGSLGGQNEKPLMNV
jgi:hypothetical protein